MCVFCYHSWFLIIIDIPSLFEGKIPVRKIHIKFIAMKSSNRLLKNFLPLLFLSLLTYLSPAQKIGLLMDSYVNERWLVDEKLFTDKIVELGGEAIRKWGAEGGHVVYDLKYALDRSASDLRL